MASESESSLRTMMVCRRALLPVVKAQAEQNGSYQCIYEIRSVPAWGAFEQIQMSMEGLWVWYFELVRVLGRAGEKPPRDHAIVAGDRCPTQAASPKGRAKSTAHGVARDTALLSTSVIAGLQRPPLTESTQPKVEPDTVGPFGGTRAFMEEMLQNWSLPNAKWK